MKIIALTILVSSALFGADEKTEPPKAIEPTPQTVTTEMRAKFWRLSAEQMQAEQLLRATRAAKDEHVGIMTRACEAKGLQIVLNPPDAKKDPGEPDCAAKGK